MTLNQEIIPLYEARVYLTSRFTDNRPADRIDALKTRASKMNNINWSFYEMIKDIQYSLDKTFLPDETMRRYFTPLKTKTDVASDIIITLGGMLISIPGDLDERSCFDDLVNLYRLWPKEFLTKHFYMSSVSTFFPDSDESEQGMEEFVTAAEKLLVENEDKWVLIDAATNPFPHLEKLRPLVNAIADEIKKLCAALEPFLRKNIIDIREYGSDEKILKQLLRFDLTKDRIDYTAFFQSILSINVASVMSSSYKWFRSREIGNANSYEGKPKIRIVAGVFLAALTEKNGDNNPDEHLYLLKLISDPMRFNVLRDMCDNYTYGLELAEKYKTTRSAMYYHLEKLVSRGLIELKPSEYRIFYTMNKKNVYDKLNAMRDYLLNGWKPEDDNKETGE